MQPQNNSGEIRQRWHDGNGGVSTVRSRPGQTEISYQNGGSGRTGYVNSGIPYRAQPGSGRSFYERQRRGAPRSDSQSARMLVKAGNAPSSAQEAELVHANAGGSDQETNPQRLVEEQPASDNLLMTYRRSHLNSPGGRIRSMSRTSRVFGSNWW